MVGMLGFFFLVLLLLAGLALGIVKIVRGNTEGKQDGMLDEEAKIIQELHQELGRMEQRIEALETILLDEQGRKERK
ncbi:phage-shock protein [Dethiosulfatarculus sandiegensis]|uniref:Phage-shock protein n=2 Tax=Dethiosulfatarculus sandiegensis TaxID=1429043 RepID=A0A0D2JNQ2_9BACT|nr:phage-shock protein [Dethiosulfatarculus sandiegensis]